MMSIDRLELIVLENIALLFVDHIAGKALMENGSDFTAGFATDL
jgi:hypothetical protein